MNALFAEAIEKWYNENKRDLPWRNTNDPYRIWVSEIILQQTRVVQGYDYFLRFMKRFPDVVSLADANEDEVLLQWQGLGYYSRARNLHRAAMQVVSMGGFPHDFNTIRSLPGIGDYTAAAIASFAFGEPHAVLDGNVYRVLSRYFDIDTPIDTTPGKHLFTNLAAEMLDNQHPALYNQAIMDFGALQCTPSSPSCQQCPLCETCEALRAGHVEHLPIKSKQKKIRTRHLIYIYIRSQHFILLHRRGGGDIWNGLYEPYLVESESIKSDGKSLVQQFNTPCTSIVCLIRGVKHQLTHQTLLADFYLLELPSIDILPSDFLSQHQLQIVSEAERDNFAAPRLVLELYKKLSEYDQKHTY